MPRVALAPAQSASYWAQGGLAAALAPDDDPGQHLADTLAAGRGPSAATRPGALRRGAGAGRASCERRGIQFDLPPAAS